MHALSRWDACFSTSKVKRLIFPLQRDALFGKSRLVSFNEVSKGPDDFSTSWLFLFYTLVRTRKIQMYFVCISEPHSGERASPHNCVSVLHVLKT